jgi:hypothetical protein
VVWLHANSIFDSGSHGEKKSQCASTGKASVEKDLMRMVLSPRPHASMPTPSNFQNPNA